MTQKVIECNPGEPPVIRELDDVTVEYLQDAVGIPGKKAYVAACRLKICHLWVDEDGLLKNLVPNIWATSVLRDYAGDTYGNQIIVGSVVLAGGNGGLKGLSKDALKEFANRGV